MLTNAYFSRKCCNKLPILTDTEEKRSQKIFKKIGPGGYFNISIVLDSRTFHWFFASGRTEMSSSGGDNDKFRDGTVAILGDEGESCHIRTIGKEMRNVLPRLLDLTLLRWLREKVQDPVLGLGPYSLS